MEETAAQKPDFPALNRRIRFDIAPHSARIDALQNALSATL